MQEEINAIRAAYYPSNKTEEENKKLCAKYPFLAWYGDPLYTGYTEEGEPDYSFTWEDELPEGWRKAFCPKMWDELKEILEKHNYLDKFRFVQIKEKWGALRIYDNGAPEEVYDEIEDWEAKYEKLSEEVCINCGKPSKYVTLGWITFVCEDCAKESKSCVIDKEDLDDYYLAPRDQKDSFIKKL
jgi:hypothetical protein